MSTPFGDHFGRVAAHYAEFRPTYPPELFVWLAEHVPSRRQAWDCACGTGQASRDLARHFQRVLATDASATQIAEAESCPGVEYHVAPADASGLAVASIDLVCVAQALHWFDLERFYAEVRRVLRPGGLLAVWSYGVLQLEERAIDHAVQHFYHQVVGPYWPPGRRHVEDGYRNLSFPFLEQPVPTFVMTVTWSLPALLGYFRSWSATARYQANQGVDPVTALGETLLPLWGAAEKQRRVSWPLTLRAGR